MGGFAGHSGNTVPSHFAALVGADPSLPLLTHYDDASGERTELSGATLANWVAKTANLLVDGVGLSTGDHATIWLPPHWQTAAVLLGSWSAGLTVGYGEPTAEAASVAFASAEVLETDPPIAAVDEKFVLGLAPMGRPMVTVPDGWTDYVTAVRGHGDHFAASVAASAVALVDPDGTPVTQSALVQRAQQRAEQLGIPPATRVLIDADAFPYPLDWLLAPISVGSPIVLCTHTDAKLLPARVETEQAAHVSV